MKKAWFLLVILCFEYSVKSNSSDLVDPSIQSSFEATTPCGTAIRKLLRITADDKSDMMKWELILNRDANKLTPATFRLIYEYGIPKQGTRGFKDGSKKVELNGNWSVGKGIATNKAATIITLTAPGSPVSLSFLQADENILHLLDNTKQLLIGTAAWSYTLNRRDPVPQKKSTPITVASSQVLAATDTVGIFEGRTPCNSDLTGLHGISTDGCQLIKCQLILLQNATTHTPSSFVLKTIYVGKGDNKYSITGKWKVMRRSANDASATIYQLKPDADRSGSELLLLKEDNNILFFVDSDCRLLVGNSYCSYTLNRANK